VRSAFLQNSDGFDNSGLVFRHVFVQFFEYFPELYGLVGLFSLVYSLLSSSMPPPPFRDLAAVPGRHDIGVLVPRRQLQPLVGQQPPPVRRVRDAHERVHARIAQLVRCALRRAVRCIPFRLRHVVPQVDIEGNTLLLAADPCRIVISACRDRRFFV